MAEPSKPTVWLLGSGFSKPLGGPLLRDLFRYERQVDIEPFFDPDLYPRLAESLPWVQTCYAIGLKENLWENAEQFLTYVDDAYRGHVVSKRARLQNLLRGMTPTPLNRPRGAHSVVDEDNYWRAFRADFTARLDLNTKRALAAECERFILNPAVATEPWLPYREWVKNLQPGTDTIISFNYDRVIETTVDKTGQAGKFWMAMPGQSQPPNTIPLLKLHGSTDWILRETSDKSRREVNPDRLAPDRILKNPDDDIAIAPPGGAKAEFVTMHLADLWAQAATALESAYRLIIVGYSFPDTDPFALNTLIGAFARGTLQHRYVHTVLGAEPGSTAHRLRSIIRSTAKNRAVQVSEHPELISRSHYLGIVQHPLGTQDFIARHEAFTTAGSLIQ